MSQTWVKSLDSLKNSLPLGEFSVWVKPLGAIEKNSTLHLLAPSASALKYINNHKKIKSAIVLAVAEQNNALKIKFGVADSAKKNSVQKNITPLRFFLTIVLKIWCWEMPTKWPL